MPDAATGPERSSPEERLEWLRFCAREGQPEFSVSLQDWMQEVEAQLANLRERLNSLPAHATREPIRW